MHIINKEHDEIKKLKILSKCLLTQFSKTGCSNLICWEVGQMYSVSFFLMKED